MGKRKWQNLSKERVFLTVDEWECCWYHPELNLILMVYVDDFKMAGPSDNIKKGWQLIEKHIKLDP